jgi:hypothetical protein
VPPAARAWLAAPPAARAPRWTQTSGDVTATSILPPGTRASELSVSITPDSLRVTLRWLGALAAGALGGRAAPAASSWSLEDGELTLLLAKAERGAWWRRLLEGQGVERGYLQLLKEAVEADEGGAEPREAELAPEARALLGELRRRQALVAGGELSLEDGFDDFRIGLSEALLRPGDGGGA